HTRFVGGRTSARDDRSDGARVEQGRHEDRVEPTRVWAKESLGTAGVGNRNNRENRQADTCDGQPHQGDRPILASLKSDMRWKDEVACTEEYCEHRESDDDDFTIDDRPHAPALSSKATIGPGCWDLFAAAVRGSGFIPLLP